MSDTDIVIVHFTDLHVGLSDQQWLWPTVKHAVLDDLRDKIRKVGAIDLVIFSGDMVQSGLKEEFDKLDLILAEIWSVFKSEGCNPRLFHVPGNHDLERPPARDPSFLNILRWWEDTAVQQDFWKNAFGYFDKLVHIFAAYKNWSDGSTSTVPFLTGCEGLLPGDLSSIFIKDNFKLGLIGLNSTWLQFSDGDLRAKLAVETRQLHAITDNDPRRWCESNDANILITHQPPSWLHRTNYQNWETEIFPSNRFEFHLFGHMHAAESTNLSTFGAGQRVSLQGSSLFGLQYLKDKTTSRIHGYSILKFNDSEQSRSLRSWPRSLFRSGAGNLKIIPDHRFELEDENYLVFDHYKSGPKLLAPSSTPAKPAEDDPISDKSAPADFPISALAYHVTHDLAHEAVRKLDQHRAKEVLKRSRSCWIVSAWGMAAEEFISCVVGCSKENDVQIFRVNVADFKDKDQFSAGLKEAYGFGIESLIDQLAEAGSCVLILDEITTGELAPPGEMTTEEKLENLSEIMLEYCPDLEIIFRSRVEPIKSRVLCIKLQPFDAADLRGYVGTQKGVFSELVSASSLQTLLRHTDGVPIHIDSALEQLEVIPLSELINSNSDFISEPTADLSRGQSDALSDVIGLLKSAMNPSSQRSFDLLKVLSIFPRGEQLSRISRFRGPQAFYPQNATELRKLSLIEASTSHLSGLEKGEEASIVLVAPRQVRERVRKMLTPSDYQSMNRRAAELYFGSEWESGIFKPTPAYRFDNSHCGSSEIQNANAIAIRVLKDALDFGGEREIGAALGLAFAYAKALLRGDHFGNAAIFLDDFFPLIPLEGYEKRRALLAAKHAEALRMTGETQKAKGIIEKIDTEYFDNSNKQSMLVDLLFCNQSLGDEPGVLETGQKILEIDKNTNQAWQAKSVILELQPDTPERTRKLRTLANFCRKNNANVVANEIFLFLARTEKGDPAEKVKLLEPIIANTSSKKDYYSRLRAVMELAKISLAESGMLSVEQQIDMIASYHYLFNENLAALFDRCHSILWDDFAAKEDAQNIARLYRHSSLSWRLRGRMDKENAYTKKAKQLFKNKVFIEKIQGSREYTYFESRASVFVS